MTRSLRISAVALAALGLLVACGDDDDSSDTTAAGGGGDGGGSVTIDSFSIEESVTCSGETADVPATWSTSNADGVDFSVDGEPVPADAGNPASGSGNVPVPCDGSEHEVTLTASGGGDSATDTKKVTTDNS